MVKLYLNEGGTFDKVFEGHDTAKHTVTFRIRTRAPLRALAEHIAVEIEGLADTQGYIGEFTDITTEAVNETLTPGGQFSISGRKLKVTGDAPELGVYFVSAAENTAAKLIGVIPALGAGKWKAEVNTQYSGGSRLLKEARGVESNFTLTVA
jgi:hypothetical protein